MRGKVEGSSMLLNISTTIKRKYRGKKTLTSMNLLQIWQVRLTMVEYSHCYLVKVLWQLCE